MKNLKSLLLLLALPLLLAACNGPVTPGTNTMSFPEAATGIVEEDSVESAETSEPEVLIDIDNLDLKNVPAVELTEIEGFVPPEEVPENVEEDLSPIEGFVPPEEIMEELSVVEAAETVPADQAEETPADSPETETTTE